MSKAIYFFLDEAGNLTFSKKGTEYFILTSLVLTRPFPGYLDLVNCRYDLVEFGFDIEGFHATEDRQPVRDRVFKIIHNHLDKYRIDTLIVEKRKTGPSLQKDTTFYPRMVGYLLEYVFKSLDLSTFDEIIVFTDTIPLNRKRKVIQGEVKRVMKDCLPKGTKFRVMHHSSRSNICLQIVDYCSWAVFRKWERQDDRSYSLIKDGLFSEFEIFRKGGKHYY